MLVKVCDVCGEIINTDNYVNLNGGFIRSVETFHNKHAYDLGEHDICMACARSYVLSQIIDIVRKSNV